MRFPLYLGYMRFVFFYPYFAFFHRLVSIFYIMPNLGRCILNGKKSAYVEILFIFVR